MRRYSAVVIALGIALVSCGEGGFTDALAKVTSDDLSGLVLMQDKLGEVAAGLDVAEDISGSISHAEAAEHSLDPNSSAEDYRVGGHLGGYLVSYLSPNFIQILVGALQPTRPVISVGTKVELWQTADQADVGIQKTIRALRDERGQTIDSGILTLKDFDEFAVPHLGDDAGGFQQRFSIAVAPSGLVETTVWFRLDRLVAFTSIARVDDGDARARVDRVARDLEAHIRGEVLRVAAGR